MGIRNCGLGGQTTMEKFLAAKTAQALDELFPDVVDLLRPEGVDISVELLRSAFHRAAATIDNAEDKSSALKSFPMNLAEDDGSKTAKRGAAKRSGTATKSTTKRGTAGKSDAAQCQAMTKAGHQCHRRATEGKQYCTMHAKSLGGGANTTGTGDGGIKVISSFMEKAPPRGKTEVPPPALEPIAVPEMADDESEGELD